MALHSGGHGPDTKMSFLTGAGCGEQPRWWSLEGGIWGIGRRGEPGLLCGPGKNPLWPRLGSPLLGAPCPLPPTDLAQSELRAGPPLAQAVFSAGVNFP